MHPELTIKRFPSERYVKIKYQGKWIGYHIYVWEQANGPIPRDENSERIGHVHHGEKGVLCNDLSNLTHLSDAEHISLHMKERGAKLKELLPRQKEKTFTDGRWTAEHNAKTSAALMGHEVTDETRAKMSQSHMGKQVSDETKARMKAAQAARRAREQEALTKKQTLS